MNSLVVYYSLEGNTKWAAEQIASGIGGDILALIPKRAYPDRGFRKYFWGGKSAVFQESPELEPYSADLARYERVVLATPIWAGTFAPPLRTFIRSEHLSGKRLALAACSGGGSPDKAFSQMKQLLGVTKDIPTLHLVDPRTKPSEKNIQALRAFCDALIRTSGS